MYNLDTQIYTEAANAFRPTSLRCLLSLESRQCFVLAILVRLHLALCDIGNYLESLVLLLPLGEYRGIAVRHSCASEDCRAEVLLVRHDNRRSSCQRDQVQIKSSPKALARLHAPDSSRTAVRCVCVLQASFQQNPS